MVSDFIDHVVVVVTHFDMCSKKEFLFKEIIYEL